MKRYSTERTNTGEIQVPEGGYGWLVILGVFFIVFIVRGTMSSLGILFLAIVNFFDADAGTASWINSICASLALLAGPVAAALSKRFGHRKVVIAGGVLSFVALALSSFANRIWQLIITAGILNGIANSLAGTSALPFLGFYFKKRHPLASGLAFTGVGFGSVAIPPIFQYCLDNYGLRGTFLVYAALAANMCVGGALLRPPKTTQQKTTENQDEFLGNDEISSQERAESKTTAPSCCKRKCGCASLISNSFDCSVFSGNTMFVVFLISFGLAAGAQITSTVYLAPLMWSKGLQGQQVALLLSIFGASNMISGPVVGMIFSRLRSKVLRPLGVAYILYGSAMFLEISASSVVSFCIVNTLLGFFRGVYAAQSSVAVRQIVGIKLFTSAYGWSLLFGGVTQLLVPPLAGYLYDYTSIYAVAFILAGSLAVASGILLVTATFILDRQVQTDTEVQFTELEDTSEVLEYMTTTV